MKVLRDVVIKTGEYQDSKGQTKGRYKNIGQLLQDGDKEPFLKLDFQPFWEGFASLYKPKKDGQEIDTKMEVGNDNDDLPF